MESDISSTIGGQPLNRLNQEVQAGGRVIPLAVAPGVMAMTPTAPVSVRGWLHGINWKHVAICAGIALVVWWVLSGEDPVESVKEAASTVGDAAKETAKAVTGG